MWEALDECICLVLDADVGAQVATNSRAGGIALVVILWEGPKQAIG